MEKNRFKQLLESQLGNVKPLIIENKEIAPYTTTKDYYLQRDLYPNQTLPKGSVFTKTDNKFSHGLLEGAETDGGPFKGDKLYYMCTTSMAYEGHPLKGKLYEKTLGTTAIYNSRGGELEKLLEEKFCRYN
jgi:hypothetical protein